MRPNIILTVLDTTRADIFYQMMEDGDLPAFEKIASSGIQFTNAISNGAWTVPSHASMFTGQRVSTHNTHAGNKTLTSSEPLALKLKESGYTTLGISANEYIRPEFGFDKGFDELSNHLTRYWNVTDLSDILYPDSMTSAINNLHQAVYNGSLSPSIPNLIYKKLIGFPDDLGAENITARTKSWLQQNSDNLDPFFYFINYLEPHLPYDPPAEIAQSRLPPDVSYERASNIEFCPWKYITGKYNYSDRDFQIMKSLYEAELKYVDQRIAEIWKTLKEENLLKNTIFLIVGDHGENIGEHDLMDHQYSLYQTLLNVPLIISGAGIQQKVSSELVEIRDIYPTVLSLAKVDKDSNKYVSSNILLEEPGRDYVISEYLSPMPTKDHLRKKFGTDIRPTRPIDRSLRAIQDNQWKLIEGSDGSVELFNLSNDPHESNNLKNHHPEEVRRLKELIENVSGSLEFIAPNQTNVSDDVRDRLDELGYIQ